MGCYGIGLSRLIAAIIEASHDERGVIWTTPEIAPFDIAIINLKPNDTDATRVALSLYEKLKTEKKEVLLDDTDSSAGVKFANMDLIGVPKQIIIGKKFKEHGLLEVKDRKTKEVVECKEQDWHQTLSLLPEM